MLRPERADSPFYQYRGHSFYSRHRWGQSCSSYISHRDCPGTYLPPLFQRETQTRRTTFRTRGPACSSSGEKDWNEEMDGMLNTFNTEDLCQWLPGTGFRPHAKYHEKFLK